jgi:glycosyltransferase involved in cell wall biosynthesis
MKICVYAICRDESTFVDRMIESCIDADEILICDTGSTDSTKAKIARWSSTYPKIRYQDISVKPWRFDLARNIALGLVSPDMDICVSIDLDEILTDGWRNALESQWTPTTTRARYRYVWSWDEYQKPLIVQTSDKIHARSGYIWRCPCHEYLSNYVGNEQIGDLTGFAVHHHPDPTKSRGQYLPLLEMGAREDQWSDRASYYLGREYFFQSRYLDAIRELERHRKLPTLWWHAERAASHRVSAKCYTALGRHLEAKKELLLATEIDPLFREGWNELSTVHYVLKEWKECLDAAEHALAITKNHGTYICDEKFAFGPTAFDLASIACWNLGIMQKSEEYCTKALEIAPTDARLLNNLKMIRETPK